MSTSKQDGTAVAATSPRQRLILVILLALLLGLSLYHFAFSARAAIAHGVVDFPIFLRHAQNFLETGTLYYHADDLRAYAPSSPVYKFPPLYAVFLLPLVRDGIRDSVYWYHWGLQLLIYAAALGLGVHALRGRAPARFAVAALLLALNFEPFFETLWRLQIETPLLLLLAIVLWGLLTRRDLIAGSALAFCAMLKIYPAFLLLYLLLRRRWKALAAFAVAAGLLQILTLAVIGIEQNRLFFFRLLPAMLGQAAQVSTENVGLGRYVYGLLPPGAPVARWLSLILTLALLGVSSWAVLRRGARQPRGGETVALGLSLFIALMLLIMANSWTNYQLLLLLPYLVLLAQALRPEGSNAALLAGLAFGALFLLFYAPCAEPSVGWPCAQTPYFLGLFRLPRPFHDFMVRFRIVGTLVPWALSLLLLLRPARGIARSS